MTLLPHVVLVLVTAAALVVMLGTWGVPAPAGVTCMDDETREHMRVLMLTALDTALKEQTAKLFDNRLKDREHHPERILRGMRGTVYAYTRSRAVVKQWDPPLC